MKRIDMASEGSRPMSFNAGPHEVRLWKANGRWHLALDGAAIPTWFRTMADAWTAGVTEADRRDRAGK